MNNPSEAPRKMTKAEAGRLGGSKSSPKKRRAVRLNGKLGGRPRMDGARVTVSAAALRRRQAGLPDTSGAVEE